jgi:long-chain acyl-CoA synthetase
MVPKFSLSKMVQFSCVLKEGESLPFRAVVVEKEDLAFLQYTGGTTGVAKGAMLTHANIIANVLQNQAWLQPALQRGEKIDQLFIVCALPLYHVFALTVCGLLGLRVGAVNVLIPNPRDLKGMVKQLSRYQFHIFPGVNTLFNGLLNYGRVWFVRNITGRDGQSCGLRRIFWNNWHAFSFNLGENYR